MINSSVKKGDRIYIQQGTELPYAAKLVQMRRISVGSKWRVIFTTADNLEVTHSLPATSAYATAQEAADALLENMELRRFALNEWLVAQ